MTTPWTAAQDALLRLIELVEQELGAISDGHSAIAYAQRELLQRIKTRQASLSFE